MSSPTLTSLTIADPGDPYSSSFLYRPELDALRFFAFSAVLVHHGPHAAGLSGIVIRIGGFGLSMFFLLSAFLITDLLLCERANTGTIAWNLFLLRRALRIWPLYYAALGTALLIGLTNSHLVVNGTGAFGMLFFIVNWVIAGAHLGVVAPLWSISIEEQFYLIWPVIVWAGGKRLALVAAILFPVGAVVWIWIFAAKGWLLWFDTPVEFLFFGAGAIIAMARGTSPDRSRIRRIVMFAVGLSLLVFAARAEGIGTESAMGITRSELLIGYGSVVTGCSIIFVATLGISGIPRALVYLGKVSYGLYVFHSGALYLTRYLIAPLRMADASILNMLTTDLLSLLMCVALAHLSYKYYEWPFLALKRRFEVVRPRPYPNELRV